MMTETHHFLALNADYRQCNLNISNGTGYEKWENAKEYKVVRQTGSLTQTEERVWEQRALVNWSGQTTYAQEQPSNDTRVVQEDVTLESGKMKRTEYGYDLYNNVTSMVERDFGTAGSPGPIVRRTNRTFATVINGYCYSGLNGPSGSCTGVAAGDNDRIHQRRLMLTETVQDVSLNQEARTEIEYDNYLTDANHSAIQVNAGMVKYNSNRFASYNPSFQPRGNVTSVRRWIVGSIYATSFSQYDEAGQVVKAIDPRGFATSISYTDNFGDGANPESPTFIPAGPTYAMTTSVTNALGHVVKMQWDYTRGSATGVKDANGVIAKTEYNDPFDRPTRVTSGYGLTGSETAISEMSYPSVSANEMRSSRQLDSTRWLSSRTQYDGFGRPVLASQNEDGLHYSTASWSIHAKTIYDGLGRAVKATNPYRGSGGAATDGWTRSTYDVAGRMTEVATFSGSPSSPPPDTGTNSNWTGSVITTYNGEVTTVRDQAGKQRRSTVDGLGRLKTVEEMMEWPSSVVYATTSYSYDARGNLKQVTQGSQTRSFSYDGLSRLTSATNPESGQMSYTYDANSNLKTKTDARPVTTTYSYDELNRVTMRDYSDTTPDVSYVYDPPISNGKGRLSSVTSSVSGYNYTAFDAQGRVTQYNQQTSGQLYTMSASYNKGGLMVSETYPSQKVIETQYDGAGRIAGVKKQSASGFIAGAASSDAVNRLQYTPHGGVSAMKLGNGLWEHVNFNSRLQPTQIGLGTSSTTSGVLQLDYGYGASASVNNGNITSQTITAPGLNVTQTYSYDQVNRLLSASEGVNWTQTYDYDVYGNRAVRNGSYIPTPALTPRSNSAADLPNLFFQTNNRIKVAGFNYDLVGNLTSDPTTAANAMVYDGENRQTSYTKAGATTSYSYDGDGRRVKKVDSTGTTVFVYNAAGQLVAEYAENGGSGTATMSYLTLDHLGSTRVVTDGSGVVKARHDYLPFGEEIETSIGGRGGVAGYAAVDSTRQRFTGQQRDTESGLDYFLARYYSASQGRFTSADTFGGSIPSPQTLNLYSYVQNNPLSLTDPTGHRSEPLSDKGDQGKLDWARKQGARHSSWFPGLKDWRIVESQDKDGKLVRNYVWDRNYIHQEGDESGVGKDSGGGTRDYQYVDKWGRAIHLWGDPKKDPSQEADHGYAIVTADEEKPGQALYSQGHGEPPPSYVNYADAEKAVRGAGYVKVWDPEPSHRGGTNWVTQKSPTLHITLYPKHQIVPHQDCAGCPVTYTQRYVNQRSTFHVDRWTQGGTWKELVNHLKEYFEK